AFNLTALSIAGGTANFSSGAAINAVTLGESGGVLTGSDTVTVSGLTTWTNGNMTGVGVTNANGGLTIAFGNSYPTLDARTLNNAGTATQTTNTNADPYYNLNVADGATINNLAGAIWDFQNDGDIYQGAGAAGTFNNA